MSASTFYFSAAGISWAGAEAETAASSRVLTNPAKNDATCVELRTMSIAEFE